jgi:pyrimidine-specific ribonucleoside hydrolase
MTPKPTPLIIDTDPGVDDAFAIALAACSPEVDLRAVTTVYGNVAMDQTTRNALQILALCGRDDVLVAAGAKRPLVYPHPGRTHYAHGMDGLGGRAASLPQHHRVVEQRPAVELLADVIEASNRPVTIAAIAPLTNIAVLLSVYPELGRRIGRLVIMGGAAFGGNITASAEFNIWSDPEAARRVLVDSDIQTTLVPLDLTHRSAVAPQWLDALSGSGRTPAALVSLSPPYRAHYQRMLGMDVLVLHDAVAMAEAIWPGTLRCRKMRVDVECGHGPARGAIIADARLHHIDPPVGRDIEVALDADLDALRELLLKRLSANP